MTTLTNDQIFQAMVEAKENPEARGLLTVDRHAFVGRAVLAADLKARQAAMTQGVNLLDVLFKAESMAGESINFNHANKLKFMQAIAAQLTDYVTTPTSGPLPAIDKLVELHQANYEETNNEQDSFLADHMLQIGFEIVDDDATVYACTLGQVKALLAARGVDSGTAELVEWNAICERGVAAFCEGKKYLGLIEADAMAVGTLITSVAKTRSDLANANEQRAIAALSYADLLDKYTALKAAISSTGMPIREREMELWGYIELFVAASKDWKEALEFQIDDYSGTGLPAETEGRAALTYLEAMVGAMNVLLQSKPMKFGGNPTKTIFPPIEFPVVETEGDAINLAQKRTSTLPVFRFIANRLIPPEPVPGASFYESVMGKPYDASTDRPMTRDVKISRHGVAVDQNYRFNYDMDSCPGCKVQLLGEGGIPTYGKKTDPGVWLAWAPLPKA